MADELVRDACELAVAVAQTMEPRDVPPPLRRYLRMQKLPGPAVAATRRVLESDDDFRSRVAEVATQDAIDRASWLFLVRPEGWDEELSSLSAEASSRSSAVAEGRDERSARRKLASVEAKLAAADAARRDATARLDTERSARAAAEASVHELRVRVDALRHERDDARHRLALAEARTASEPDTAAPAVAAPSPPVPEPALPPPAVDLGAVTAAIADAAAAVDRVRDALTAAAQLVTVDDDPTGTEATVPPTPPGTAASSDATRRRAPLKLPGGVFDDTVDAAEWLVRRPGVVVLVDGYNCTLRDTPIAGLAIAEQRRRLVDALTELASRTHADVEVVFDGADVDQPLATRRRGVRVTFSPPGTEADDVVIARAGALPPDRPVVVASSDNRVRAGAADNGANVISAEQLMAVVRARR